MKIYDGIIKETKKLLSKSSCKTYTYGSSNLWDKTNKNEVILKSDVSVELSSNTLKGASYVMFTTSSDVEVKDEVVVIGKDISQLQSKSVPFGKVVVIKLKDIDEETVYTKLKDLERLKFRLKLQGYMLRASTSANKECVRISKNSVDKGIDFFKIGNAFISEYKQYDFVESVTIYYITENENIVDELCKYAQKTKEITDAMNNIFDDLELDCHSCTIKEICDEVEGIREQHQEHINSYKKK